MTSAGFPHSDIPGSQPVSGSPRLFAAYHVLHRLSLPRHPPYALSSLTTIISEIESLYPCVLACYGKYLYIISLCNCQRTVMTPGAWAPELNPGGGERVRTDDLLRARQALSQLSYTPD